MRATTGTRAPWLRTGGLGLHGNALMGALGIALLMAAVLLALLPGH
jgi:hypothetical protein